MRVVSLVQFRALLLTSLIIFLIYFYNTCRWNTSWSITLETVPVTLRTSESSAAKDEFHYLPRTLLNGEPRRSPKPFIFGISNLSIEECPFNCNFFGDEKLFHQADAAIIDNVQSATWMKKFLANRHPSQMWVFYFMESPARPQYASFPLVDVFNFTMTYRRDSDFPVLYGNYTQKPSIKKIPFKIRSTMSNHSLLNLNPHQKKRFYLKYIGGKRKLLAWAASHDKCKSPGGREEIVRRIEKYLPLDKYRSCGNLSCKIERYNPNFISCYEEMGAKYKFYLSFENSLCKDYVTEKFFLALTHGMIPIVYGDANYEVSGPPGSFIKVSDYESIKDLAEYIKFLDGNHEEYLKYFVWTDYYQISRWTSREAACGLCGKMWEIFKHNREAEDYERTGNSGRGITERYESIYRNITDWIWYDKKSDRKEGKDKDDGIVRKDGHKRLICRLSSHKIDNSEIQ